jgi:hypothetical protein
MSHKNDSRHCALLLAFSALLLNGCAQTETVGKVTLWSAYNAEAVMRDFDYTKEHYYGVDPSQRKGELNFSCAKNEKESAQFIFTSDHDISSFDFTLSDAKNAKGDILAKDNFEILAEHYVEVSSSNEADSYPGYYPDALVPLKSYQFRHMNHLDVGQDADSSKNSRNQGIWVNLNVPSSTPAGTYEGKGVLTLDQETYDVPVRVKVYDFALPEEIHANTAFLIWYDQIAYGEGKNSDEAMAKSYYDFAVDHRISPASLPDAYNSSITTLVDYYAEHIANNPRITSYRLPLPTGSSFESSLRSLLNAFINKNIALRKAGDTTSNLFSKIYVYVDDEPTAANYPTVKSHALSLKSVVNDLASSLADYPDLRASLLDLRNIVTAAYVEALDNPDEGQVNTWCPQFQHFATPELREAYHQRQSKGDHVWWYGCISPKSPYPSYHLDANLLSSRLLSWMQFDYGVEGNLYWCMNFYRHGNGGSQSQRDIWNDPNTWEDCNGDGQLYYPGLQFGIKGPIATERLESIREASEDYEYLYRFTSEIAAYNKAQGKSISAGDLLAKFYYQGLFDGVVCSADSSSYAAKRETLLATLEKMESDLKGTVESLVA